MPGGSRFEADIAERPHEPSCGEKVANVDVFAPSQVLERVRINGDTTPTQRAGMPSVGRGAAPTECKLRLHNETRRIFTAYVRWDKTPTQKVHLSGRAPGRSRRLCRRSAPAGERTARIETIRLAGRRPSTGTELAPPRGPGDCARPRTNGSPRTVAATPSAPAHPQPHEGDPHTYQLRVIRRHMPHASCVRYVSVICTCTW